MLKNKVKNARFLTKEVLLKNYTTIRTGGKTTLFTPKFPLEAALFYKKYSPLVLGNGSNLLIGDKGVKYSMETSSLNKITLKNMGKKVLIRCEAGVKTANLLSFCKSKNVGGLEFLAGIPASVGGATLMNAGAFGKSLDRFILSVGVYLKSKKAAVKLCGKRCPDYVSEYFGVKVFAVDKSFCGFSYRSSVFSKVNSLILYTDFLLDKVSYDLEKEKKYLEKRKSSQPSAKTFGSVFKNPENGFAGEIIESCNLKGLKIGGAKISDKHANFIENTGNATSFEIYKLIKTIQKEVKRKKKIKLSPEVKIFGKLR